MKKINLILLSTTLFSLCTFSGCIRDKDSSTTSISLDEANSVTHTFVVKTNGNNRIPDVTIEVYKENVMVKSAVTNYIGKAEIKLPKDNYKVELKNLPQGVYYKNSFEINSSSVDYTFECLTRVINDTIPADKVYQESDIVYDFTVTDTDGNEITLSKLFENGKYLVMLNFWASWCGPCKYEFPHIQEAYLNYSEDIEIIGFNIESDDTNSSINEFKEDYGLTFPMVRDKNGEMWYNYVQYDPVYGNSIPVTAIINKYGVVEFIQEGAFQSASELDEIINGALQRLY